MNVIVIYYSKTGSAERITKQIAKGFESPLLKVEADVLYGGFFFACARMVVDRLQKSLPKSIAETPDVSDCDTLFLGFPIWWDDVSDCYKEFFGRLETDGKCLIPLTTSDRSDTNRAIESLRALSPGAEIRDPFHLGTMQHDDYALWKRGLSEDAAIEDAIHRDWSF